MLQVMVAQTLSNKLTELPAVDSTSARMALSDWLFALTLQGLTYGDSDLDERVLSVRVYLQFFNHIMVSPVTKSSTGEQVTALTAFLSATLPVLCASISRFQNEIVFVTVLGQALTLMARQCNEEFRQQITPLSESNKQFLQQAMKLALQAEQQQQQQQQQQSLPVGGLKSINIDKYRNK
jgi:hypothetical protein